MSKFWKSWFTAYKKKKLFFVNGSARVLEKQMKLKKKKIKFDFKEEHDLI